MLRSKVTEILSVLPGEEVKEIRLFVNSPIYNKNKNIIKLYEALKPFYPDFGDKKCTREFLFRKVYGNKAYNDKMMRNLISEMYKLLEEYLVYKSSKLPMYKEMLLFEYLINFDNIFPKKYNEAGDALKQSKLDNYYFRKRGNLLRGKIRYFLDRNKQHKITMEALQRGENHIFDLLANLPENIANILANEYSFNAEYGFKASEKFFEYFDYTKFINSLEGNHPDFEFLKLNYHKFMLFYSGHPEDINHSREIKNYLHVNYHKFSEDYLFEVFLELSNFYIMKTEKGYEEEIIRDRFDMYRLQLKIGVLLSDSHWLRSGLFGMIIRTALELNEIRWAEEFMISHIESTHPSERNYLLNYGNALIAFKKKQFQEVISLCGNMNQDKHESKLFVKWILFRVYYELGYTEQFYYHSETLRKYVENSNFIIPQRKKNYKMVINLGNRLMNLKVKEKLNPEDLYFLKKEVDKLSGANNSFKIWMLEKIEELEKQKY
jgi:hypothetical protein